MADEIQTRPDGTVWVPACDVYECDASRGAFTTHYAVSPAEATRLIDALPGLARTGYYHLRVDHPLQQEAPAVRDYWLARPAGGAA
jgi:hypothetical protein